jgi:outer membrane protein assembly factor BamB
MRRTFILALCLALAACSGTKRKSALERQREREARELAEREARDQRALARARPPRAEVTPEQFAQLVSQSFGDADLGLIDPEGRVYQGPERRWERDLRFDPSNPAYDKARGIVYGATKSGRDVVAFDIRSGRTPWRSPGLLRPPPRKVDPKKIENKNEQPPMDPVFELTGDALVVAQNVPKAGGGMQVHLAGLDARSGRVRWRKRVPYDWKDTWVLWSEKDLVFLGDSSTGPLYLFGARNGRQGKIDYPPGEDYIYGGSDGQHVVFHHGRPNKDYFLAAYDAQGKVLWRRPVGDCYGSKAYFAPMLDGVFPCKLKTSAKEHADRVMRVSYADGSTLWEVTAHKRKGDPLTDAQRPDLVSMRRGKDGAYYFRNRFDFVRVEEGGRVAWSYPLKDKEIFLLVNDEPYRSDNVIRGDRAYEWVASLDAATGKERWRYIEEDGVPARGWIREGTLLLHGDSEVRVLSLADGKLLFRIKTSTLLDGAMVLGPTVVVDSLGVRQTLALRGGQVLLYDKSEDETVVNKWMDLGPIHNLVLYHDDDRRLAVLEPVTGDRRVSVSRENVRKARLLTPPPVEVEGLHWVDAATLEFTSVDDRRAWRVPVGGGAPSPAGPRRESARAARGGMAFLDDPVKVTERRSLKVERDGKVDLVSARPTGELAWSRSGSLLAYAERRDASLKSKWVEVVDLVVRVYDARSRRSRDVLHLKGADKQATLSSVSFGPGDGSLSMVIESLYGNHYVGTVPLGGRTVGEMRVNAEDGIVSIKIPNQGATRKLGVDSGDNYGFLGWSADGSTLATVQGQRMQLRDGAGRELLRRPEAAVSAVHWAPRGATLYYVKDGNLWRWRRGRVTQLTFFLPKREPRNEEEMKLGNVPRIGPVAFSPDGRRLAFGLRWPENQNMRVAVMDL